jgi:hypothetical protein
MTPEERNLLLIVSTLAATQDEEAYVGEAKARVAPAVHYHLRPDGSTEVHVFAKWTREAKGATLLEACEAARKQQIEYLQGALKAQRTSLAWFERKLRIAQGEEPPAVGPAGVAVESLSYSIL